MKKIFLTLSLCLLVFIAKGQNNQTQYYKSVNPFIGTDFTGNTYPGGQAPFGMVQLSPDNGLGGWDRISGYFYPDSTIAGFSHTHLSGTGAGDLYAGGFLHALSDGFDLRRCGEIGTIAAGRVVEIVGTKLPEETWDEIRRICALYRGFMHKLR